MMEEFFHNFHFLRPWILLLTILPIFLYGLYFKGINTQSSWQKVIDKKLLNFLLIKGSATKRRIYIWTALVGTIVSVIAAAGPCWEKIEVPAFAPQNPVMIVLNMSSDMSETDLQPSRLNRAKYKIKDFLSLLKGVQTGLEVYSNEPFVIAPLTEDTNILQNLLPAIGFDIMPANGDRLDRAIDLAVSKIKSSGYNGGRVVIFTPDVGQKFDLVLAAAKRAVEDNVKIDVIGVSASSNEKLAMIASAGKGKYWVLQADDSMLKNLADEINKSNGKLEKSENLRTIWLDAGFYLIFIPLICCLVFFRKGLLIIALLCTGSNASAGFFLNDNQEGLLSFNRQEYSKAAEQFKDNNWQGASFYRAGDYQKALIAYQKDNSPEGLYNQGNALAKGNKINEAIAKYEEVLKQNPDHEDAKFNLEYLKKQQQQQQQNKSQSNNDKQNQQQKENQSSSADDNQQSQNQDKQNNQESNQQQEGKSQQQDSGTQDKNSDQQNNNAEEEKQSNTMNELDKNNQQDEGQKQGGALPEEGKEDNYNEEMQAKAQQYRDIPEDPGGLLKAFIYQEYQQNRYNEQ